MLQKCPEIVEGYVDEKESVCVCEKKVEVEFVQGPQCDRGLPISFLIFGSEHFEARLQRCHLICYINHALRTKQSTGNQGEVKEGQKHVKACESVDNNY